MAPVVKPPTRTRLCASFSTDTLTTPGTSEMRRRRASRSSETSTDPCTYMWPLKLSILSSRVERKPAMMLITLISTATASMMPMKLITAMVATPPSLRFARR